MSNRQTTLGNVQKPEEKNWVKVYSHGSPNEGYLIVIPDEHVQKQMDPVTADGYDSQVQSMLGAVKCGINKVNDNIIVLNSHEAAVSSVSPSGSRPDACREMIENIREHKRDFEHEIRFEKMSHSRQEIKAL